MQTGEQPAAHYISILDVLNSDSVDSSEILERPRLVVSNDLQSRVQETLIGFWCEIFKRNDITENDDFFHLGGHSLKALQLQARIQARFGYELEIRELFETPTIAELSEQIAAAIVPESSEFVIPCAPSEIDLPLSYAEERMWFLSHLEPDVAFYNVNFHFRVDGLDVSIWEQCLNLILARHEALRTTFDQTNDTPVRRIASHKPFSLPIVDLTYLPDESREAEVERLIAAEAATPFNLQKGPLFRFTLYKVSETRYTQFMCLHHIITDGWSISNMMGEVLVAYRAIYKGQPVLLPELPIRYADFAYWQRQQMTMARLQEQLFYWKQQLRQTTVLDLPTDRPRPQIQTYHGDVLTITWSGDLAHKLQRLSEAENSTLFMTLLAGLYALFYRYTAQEDIVIGFPIANRRLVETEKLVGFFVNTLVLRVDLSGSPTFAEVLRRTRQVALEAYKNQDVPFEKIVQELELTRDLSRSPLFNVMFALQNVPQPINSTIELAQATESSSNGTTKFDIFISVRELTDGILLSVEYNTALYDAETIQRMMGHYHKMLETFAENLSQPITSVDILSETERQQLLVDWNSTERAFTGLDCLHKLFTAQAHRSPHAPALMFEGSITTFTVLEDASNRLAAYLQRCGVGVNSVVGIHLHPSPRLVAALLGVLKCGAAYLPLEPSYPGQYIEQIVNDADVRLILSDQPTTHALAGKQTVIVEIDNIWNEVMPPQFEAVQPLHLDDTACVYYTSGSTGQPKGVMTSHRAIVNRLAWMWERYPFGESEVGCQKTRLSFMDSIWEIFGFLLKGIPLVIAPSTTARDVELLVKLLANHRVTRLVVVPSLLRAMLEKYPRLGRNLPYLNLYSVSGEAISQDLVEQFFRSVPDGHLLNLYGSTELTADAIYTELSPAEAITIGCPIANVRAYILDLDMNPVPIGVRGDLYITGDCLASGFVNDLHTSSFVASPFAPSDHLFRTGDCARYLPDGKIQYLGRLDTQVKVRGMRVAPEEIEIILRLHPHVQDTVVVNQIGAEGYTELRAFVISALAEPLDAHELRRFLETQLPSHMIPVGFHSIDIFPLTSSGKINRRELSTLAAENMATPDMVAESRNDLEAALVQIWEQTLNRKPIGIYDNFFDLGGHSLLAVHLLARIETTLGKSLPLNILFKAQTVEKLAELIQERQAISSEILIPIQPLGNKNPLFIANGIGWSVLKYMPLIQHLGSEQPVYILQTEDFQHWHETIADIKAIASSQIEAIESVQPNGPYRICGHSFGGLLAFEIAQQLVVKGKEVELVAIFDTFLSPDHLPTGAVKSTTPSFLMRRVYEINHLFTTPWKEKSRYLQKRSRDMRHHMKRLFPQRKYSVHVRTEQTLHKAFANSRTLSLAAVSRYRPTPYPGILTLFVSRELFVGLEPIMLEVWTYLAKAGLETIYVPGDHITILQEPHVAVLAQELAILLDKHDPLGSSTES